MLDSGSSLSFVRRDVFENIKELGVPCTVETTQERCQIANAGVCEFTQAVILSIKLELFSWKVRFLGFDQCPVPSILGVDFLSSAQVQLDFAARRYSFSFHPEKNFQFQEFDFGRDSSRKFPCPEDVFRSLASPCLPIVSDRSAELDSLLRSFPSLFSDELGTVKDMVCHLDLVDSTPVRSRPYPCSPPRLRILREIVQDLIDKGVVVKSYSQYASPAFLGP
jgi:hypothetical protein